MLSLDKPQSSDTGGTCVAFPNVEHMELHYIPPDTARKEGPSSFSASLLLIFRRGSGLFDADVRNGVSSLVLSAEGPGWVGRSKTDKPGLSRTSSCRVMFKKDVELLMRCSSRSAHRRHPALYLHVFVSYLYPSFHTFFFFGILAFIVRTTLVHVHLINTMIENTNDETERHKT
jgi:hypothetical protein